METEFYMARKVWLSAMMQAGAVGDYKASQILSAVGGDPELGAILRELYPPKLRTRKKKTVAPHPCKAAEDLADMEILTSLISRHSCGQRIVVEIVDCFLNQAPLSQGLNVSTDERRRYENWLWEKKLDM